MDGHRPLRPCWFEFGWISKDTHWWYGVYNIYELSAVVHGEGGLR